jgi:septal ring factor EnvC (AmiA/AmiB activator)
MTTLDATDQAVIKNAQQFVDRIRSRELVIDTERASQVAVYNYKQTMQVTLSKALAEGMSYFDLEKKQSMKALVASRLVMFINEAYAHSVIKEGPALLKRLEEQATEIASLHQQLEEADRQVKTLYEEKRKFELDLSKLQGKLEECESESEKLRNMCKGVGDIST